MILEIVIGAIVLALLVFIIIWVLVTSGKVKPSWKNKPKNRYPDLVSEFGSPDILDPAPGGFAMWRKPTLAKKGSPFDNIVIMDEEIPHCWPTPHYDFVKASICLELNSSQSLDLLIILSLSKSVWYDQLKNQLWVRCDNMGANVATALLATLIALNKGLPTTTTNNPPLILPASAYKQTGMLEKIYANFITASKDKTAYKAMTKQLKDLLSTLRCSSPKPCENTVDPSTLLQYGPLNTAAQKAGLQFGGGGSGGTKETFQFRAVDVIEATPQRVTNVPTIESIFRTNRKLDAAELNKAMAERGAQPTFEKSASIAHTLGPIPYPPQFPPAGVFPESIAGPQQNKFMSPPDVWNMPYTLPSCLNYGWKNT
jgi:hypothetical protein